MKVFWRLSLLLFLFPISLVQYQALIEGQLNAHTNVTLSIRNRSTGILEFTVPQIQLQM